jgi:hypothetical protein
MAEGDQATSAETLTIFKKQFWARPPVDPQMRGDSSHAQIYLAVGEALSCWEAIETTMSLIFLVVSEVSESSSSTAAQRSFGCVESSATRRKMIIEVAKNFFGQYWLEARFRKHFMARMTAHENASHQRDEIAHGRVTQFYSSGPSATGHIGQVNAGIFLIAADYNTARNLFLEEPFGDDILGYNRSQYSYTKKIYANISVNCSSFRTNCLICCETSPRLIWSLRW